MGFEQGFYNLQYLFQDNQEAVIYIALFFLVFIIVFSILKKGQFFGKNNSGIPAILALAISILSTFYLTKNQIAPLLLSYSYFGMLILLLIPFFIMLVFIHQLKITSTIRRIFIAGYFIFGIYFINKKSPEADSNILIGFFLISLLAFIFDKSLNKSLKKEKSHYVNAGAGI